MSEYLLYGTREGKPDRSNKLVTCISAYPVPASHEGALHVLETELAYIQDGLLTVLLRIRRDIPGVNLPVAKVNFLDGRHWC